MNLIELIILAAIWGSSFLFMRISTPEFGPIALIWQVLHWRRERSSGSRFLSVDASLDRAIVVSNLGSMRSGLTATIHGLFSATCPAMLNRQVAQ